MLILAVLTTWIASLSPALAEDKSPVESAGNDALELTCSKGSDERTLTLVPKGQGCELHYFKQGASKVVAKSLYNSKVCEDVRGNMRKNLQASGFSCN